MSTAVWRAVAGRLAGTAAVAVTVRGVTGTANTLSSLRWLRAAAPVDRTVPDAAQHVVVIVPLLREQRVLADTVEVFTKLAKRHDRAVVVLVTTEREYHEPDPARLADPFAPTSIDLARTLTGEAPVGLVRHLHYPDPTGVMVDQVNYAARVELARLADEGLDPQRVWVGVYNADSRPNPTTLDLLGPAAGAGPALTQAPRIVQQSALFTTNLHTFPPGLRGAVLAGAALLQSRWTLAREIPRLRRQARQARAGGARWPRLAHCVGHGLFVRGDEFHRHGGLPVEPMNEDLAFGYLACASGTPIDPLPLLEHGDSPSTVRGLIRQARQWFWSYAEYPLFARVAAARAVGDRRTRTWLVAQGMARGGLWLGQSPAVAATLLLPLFARRRRPAVIAAVAAITIYAVLPSALLAAHERRNGNQVRFGVQEALGVIGAALLSSLGPWWCLANAVHRWCTGASYSHDKTER